MQGDDERKEGRVVGGARRVLREPPPDAPIRTEKTEGIKKNPGKPTISAVDKPVRPRPISSSLSTPAILLHAPAPPSTKEKGAQQTTSAGSHAAVERRRGQDAASKTATSKAVVSSRNTTTAQVLAGAGPRKESSKASTTKTAVIPPPPSNAALNPTRGRPGAVATKFVPSKPTSRKEVAKPVLSKPTANDKVTCEDEPAEVPLPPTPPPKELVDPAPEAVELAAPEESNDAVVAQAVVSVTPEDSVAAVTSPSEDVHTPEQRPRRAMQVEQTPISALVASIERGFLHSPLSPMMEGDESMAAWEEQETREQQAVATARPVAIPPLAFGRTGMSRQALKV